MQNYAFRFGHFYLLKSGPKVLKNENCQKNAIKSDKKMKSKAINLIFGESLNFTSGVRFFVLTLEVPFFLPKVPEMGPQKKALPVPVLKKTRPLL